MPFSAATAAIDTGAAVKATEEEITKAGFQVPTSTVAVAEGLPEGYKTEGHESGAGFDLFDPEGNKINDVHPIPNLAAARSLACNHANAAIAGAPASDGPDLDNMKVQALKGFAGDNNIDLGENTRKDDILAAIKANLARRATLKMMEVGGGFDVVDLDGAKLNEEPLTKEDAQALFDNEPAKA